MSFERHMKQPFARSLVCCDNGAIKVTRLYCFHLMSCLLGVHIVYERRIVLMHFHLNRRLCIISPSDLGVVALRESPFTTILKPLFIAEVWPRRWSLELKELTE